MASAIWTGTGRQISSGEHCGGHGDPLDAPALQGDRWLPGGGGTDFAEQVMFHEGA